MNERIKIEVVLATPERQVLKSIEVDAGQTARDAVRQSGVSQSFSDRDVESADLAIWGKQVAPDHKLRDGDRVEILRSLEIDPREARRQLALVGQTMRGVSEEGSELGR